MDALWSVSMASIALSTIAVYIYHWDLIRVLIRTFLKLLI